MPRFTNPQWVHVEPRRGAVAGVLVTGGVVFAVVEVVTSEAFAIAVYVAVGVVSVLIAAGVTVAARNVLRDRGRLWRGERSESLLMQALTWRPAKPVVAAVPVPALPVREPLAIEAPRPVLTGIVVERELAKVTTRNDAAGDQM